MVHSVVMEDLKKEKKNALYKYQAICVRVVGKTCIICRPISF